MATKGYLLTTFDNPYDPFDEYDQWSAFDTQNGYNTDALVMRIVEACDDLRDLPDEQAHQLAVERIVRLNPNGMYRRVQGDIDYGPHDGDDT